MDCFGSIRKATCQARPPYADLAAHHADFCRSAADSGMPPPVTTKPSPSRRYVVRRQSKRPWAPAAHDSALSDQEKVAAPIAAYEKRASWALVEGQEPFVDEPTR